MQKNADFLISNLHIFRDTDKRRLKSFFNELPSTLVQLCDNIGEIPIEYRRSDDPKMRFSEPSCPFAASLLNSFRAVCAVSFVKKKKSISFTPRPPRGILLALPKAASLRKTTVLPAREREKDSVFAFDRNESTGDKERASERDRGGGRASRCMEASAHTFVW